MSKAYIVTKVKHDDTEDTKVRIIAVTFTKEAAEKSRAADMEAYKREWLDAGKDEQELEQSENGIWVRTSTGEYWCEWNVEEKDIRIPLTPLQFTNLNGIAESIETNANDSYFSYADSLSEEEDEYLLSNLAHRGIAIDKVNEVEMRGEEARAWLATHGKENG